MAILLKRFSTVSAVLLGLQFVLLNFKLVQPQNLEVVSTKTPCPGVERPKYNEKWCYRTTYKKTPPLPFYQCEARIIPKTNRTVKFVDSLDNSAYTEDGIPQTKIWSPNKIQGKNYQPNRYCLYKAACPAGHFMYYSWVDGNFELEPKVDGECLDFVLINDFELPNEKLCGSRSAFVAQRSAPVEVVFRSNTNSSTRYPGFRMDILCVSPFFANLPNCTQLNITDMPINTTSSPAAARRRRATATKTTSYIPLTLNSLTVPRDVSISYCNNVVKLMSTSNVVLREFRDVKYFIFWTGFNGTKMFRMTAPPDVNIYGGGLLAVLKHRYTAFYSTVQIPPEFEPSDEAVQVISELLNASTPFFLPDDPLDTEPPDSPIKLHPPTSQKPGSIPPPSGAYHSKRAAATDTRVNQDALMMAEKLEDACDVFLREASRSYLRILQQFGIRR